jgi:hypothetical protein
MDGPSRTYILNTIYVFGVTNLQSHETAYLYFTISDQLFLLLVDCSLIQECYLTK